MEAKKVILSLLVQGVLIVLLTGLACGPASAKDNGITRSTYTALLEIRQLMDRDAHQETVDRLRALAKRIEGKPIDFAMVQQHLGYALAALGDLPAAHQAFEQAVDTEVLPPEVTHSIHYVLAQLYIHSGEYAPGISHLETWFKTEKNANVQSHVLAGYAYYELERYPPAITHLKQALDYADTPEASWYQLLTVIYLQTKHYTAAETLLQQALRVYPLNKQFWRTLADVYLRRQREGKALAVLTLASWAGVLEGSDLKRMARLYVQLGMPEKAARLLHDWGKKGSLPKSHANLTLEAESWLLAREREKALSILRNAAEMADDGSTHMLLGRLLFEQERWREAIPALQAALSKGGLNNPAETQLLLGIAAYNMGDYDLSEAALKQAITSKLQGNQAEHWLKLLKRTRQKHSG